MYLYSWWANDPIGVGHLLAVAAFWARPRSYKSRIGHMVRLRSCNTGADILVSTVLEIFPRHNC